MAKLVGFSGIGRYSVARFFNRGERSFHRCGAAPALWRALAAWFDSPLGQELRETEGKHLDAVLSNLFGYHLLQVGRLGHGDLLGTSRVSHAVVMDPATGCGASEDDDYRLLGLPHGLPIASTSLDVVVLPHVLEFSDTPHDVLREAERTLIPEGHIVLSGFNPWSMWFLARLLLGWRGRVPWCGRFLSRSQGSGHPDYAGHTQGRRLQKRASCRFLHQLSSLHESLVSVCDESRPHKDAVTV